MSITQLSREVVLDLAEHMDVVSLRNFMATNKNFYNLIGAYERSISDAKASRHCHPPSRGAAVLSSATIERHVLRAGTFDLVRELERRAERMDDILLRSAPTFLDLSSPPGLPLAVGPGHHHTSSGTSSSPDDNASPETAAVATDHAAPTLTTEQQGRLEPLLRLALCHCDRIADVAANSAYCEPISAAMYDLIPTGVWAQHQESPPRGDEDGNGGRDGGAAAVDPFANPAARPEQIDYIYALNPADITALFYLVSVLGSAYAQACGLNLEDDPEAQEQMVVFEECVLRHGTWFAWSYVHGDGELKEMTGHMMAAGRKELKRWETSAAEEDLPDGLRMTLFRRFRELCFSDSESDEDADEDEDRDGEGDGDHDGDEHEEVDGNGDVDAGLDHQEEDGAFASAATAADEDDDDDDGDVDEYAGHAQRRRIEFHVYELVKDIVYGPEEQLGADPDATK